jgi:cell division protein FtsQ
MFGLRRPRNRRREQKSESRRFVLPRIDWRRLAVTSASLAALGGLIGGVVWTLDQPIDRVAVQGRFQRVSPMDVEQAVKRTVGRAGLVTANLADVRTAIEQLSWVDSATVERAWPRALSIVVAEQVASARWGADGLVNARGELFVTDARHIPPELPRLSGPQGTAGTVAQRYLAIQGRLVEAGMRIAAMRLDDRGAWELDLDNGVTVRLGRRQVDERFERFVAAAIRLVAQRSADMSYVDMRYTNGFAVGWRGADGGQGARVAAAPGAFDDVDDRDELEGRT